MQEKRQQEQWLEYLWLWCYIYLAKPEFALLEKHTKCIRLANTM